MLLLTRYIIRSVVIATSLVVLILLGVETFLGLAAQAAEIGRANYTLVKALYYVLLFDPVIVYRFFPIACLMGSLIGLGGLASSSQLIAMRAAGFSVLQVISAVIKASLLMLFFVILIGEGLGPTLVNKATQMKQQALGQGNDNGAFEGVWLKQANNFIHIDNIVSDTEIKGITQYRFNEENQLEVIIDSRAGKLDEGLWKLNDSSITHITPKVVQVAAIEGQSIELKIKRKLVALSKQSSDEESLHNLFRSYHYRHQLGLSYTFLELAFWQRIMEPVLIVVMICLGVPFVFGSLRDTGMGTRIMVGGIFGFVFYIFSQFAGRFSLAANFPPFLAAIAPMVLFSLICLYLLWRVER